MEQVRSFILGTVLAALFYSIGYSFVTGYFGFYNIFVSELDLSPSEIVVHSISGIVTSLSVHSVQAWIAFLVLSIFGCGMYSHERGVNFPWSAALYIAYSGVLGIFLAALILGKEHGRLLAERNLNSLNVAIPDEEVVSAFGSSIDMLDAPFRSIYNSSTTAYFLMWTSAESPPWMVRLDRETGQVDSYFLD